MKTLGLPLLAALFVCEVKAERSQLLPVSGTKKTGSGLKSVFSFTVVIYFSSPPVFWTKLWCHLLKLEVSPLAEVAVGGALQGSSLPGLLSLLVLKV